MKIWAWVILAALIVGALGYGARVVYKAGQDDMRAQYSESEKALKKQLNSLKSDASKRLQEMFEQQAIERRKANAKIRKLYRENQAFKKWWDTPVPVDAAEYAYGVLDSKPE